jgi:hypothetical protein
VPGSHVLKGLVWYCSLAGDERLKGCALWLLDVKWKQKRNTEKSMVALTELGITREELLARNLIKERVPDPMPDFLEQLRSSLYTNPSFRIANDPDEDLLIIQGQMHFYRIHRSTGRIERATDDAALELNWHSIPDQFRLVMNREADLARRIQMQAFMLMHDGVFARYFTEKSS